MSLTVSIDFAASIARLEENSKKSADAVEHMAGRIDSAAAAARTALVGLAGAVSVAGLAAATRNAINYADSLHDLAQRAGTTVEVLSGLRLAAQLSDTSLESLATGARKLATNLVENREAFKKLGIDTSNQTEALIGLGDVFAGMKDPVERSALAVKVFGKSGEDLIPLLMEGSAGIRNMIVQGQELAGVTTQMAQQAALFNDNLDIMKIRGEGFFLTASAQLLPVLNEMVTAFNDVSKSGSAAETAGAAVATVLETIIVVGSEVSYVFTSIGREIGGVVAQFSAMGEAGGVFTKEGRAAWSLVGEEMRADSEVARKEHEAFIQSVMTARQRAQSAQANKAEGGSDNRGSNLLRNLSGAANEMDKIRQADAAAWQKYYDDLEALQIAEDAKNTSRFLKEQEEAAARELAWQQGVAQRLAALQMAGMSEAEIERGKLTAIQTDLQFARDQGWLTEITYHQMLEQAQLEHEARMGNVMAQGALARQKISQQSWMMQASTAATWLKNITSTSATSNKEMFELNKIAGISEATINTYRAAQGAFAALAPIPIVGPVLGAAAAGIAIAAGLANVQAISSAQFGSSSSPPSIAGGGAMPVFNAGASASVAESTAVPEATQPRQQIDFHFTGSQISMDQMVNEFIPRLEEAYNNGAGGGAVFNVTQN